MGSVRRIFATLILIASFAAQCCSAAYAGGGPENLVLVVNSASWASQTVANHFIQLRQVPSGNVVYVNWEGGVDTVEVEIFRQQILGVVLNEIQRRGLTEQIDYIVYSSDFPYAVDVTRDGKGQTIPKQLSPTCSINSATYLYTYVIAHNPNVLGTANNQYMRTGQQADPRGETHGFRSWYGWGRRGELVEAGGQHYMLSTMLAVTSIRGTSVREALGYLRAAAKADGTRPKGTIYYMKTSDVRSTTREIGTDKVNYFDAAVQDLKKLGVAAEVISGEIPLKKPDVQGTTIGVKQFSWHSSGSTLLGGAIGDNLTSFGGIMGEGGGHTPCTEFLRYGAAGASGTVVEPFANQDKFPVPGVHVHYARGCTLAEAYYQSVFGPFQLLIVGDPLCRPWANIPTIEARGLQSKKPVSGKLSFKPLAQVARGAPVDRFELFVDGHRHSGCAAGESLSLDTSPLPDGYHELRIVGIESSAIESQGRLIAPIMVDNHHRTIEVTSSAKDSISWDDSLKLSVKAPGMAGALFFHNGRMLGKSVGAEGNVEIDPRELGMGPVTIETVAVARGGPQQHVRAQPLQLTVKPSAPLPAIKSPPKLARGLTLKLAAGRSVPVQDTYDPNWMVKAGVKDREPFEISAYFDAPLRDVYQFQVWYLGDLKLTVDSKVLLDGKQGDYRQKFLPVSLAAGVHRLVISGKTGDRAQLRVAFGGQGGALSLNGDTFRHAE